MFKVAICDDEQLICSEIEEMILGYAKINYVDIDVEVFSSGEELCRLLNKKCIFDLIFLDIEMKGMTGIEVAGYIRKKCINYITKIVFITGREGYERQLFDVQPFNFISKPVEYKVVGEVVKLALELEKINMELFKYKKGKEVYKIPLKDIRYFESDNREVKIYAINNEDIFYGSLKKIHNEVNKYRFIQIHKSYIVNYQYIEEFGYDYIMLDDSKRLPISQLKRKQTRELQFQYEKEKLI